LLEEVKPTGTIDWSSKSVVSFREKKNGPVWAALHTKRREGVDLVLFTEPGRFALGRFAKFGDDRELSTHRNGQEAIKIRFTEKKQLTTKAFREFLYEVVTSKE
jgi:excinuclease ABC subunit A